MLQRGFFKPSAATMVHWRRHPYAERYLFDPPSTFPLPDVAAPPGFVYLACVDGNDDTGPFVETSYLAQVDLFTLVGYPRTAGPAGCSFPSRRTRRSFA